MIVTDLVVDVQRNKFFTSCSLDDLDLELSLAIGFLSSV